MRFQCAESWSLHLPLSSNAMSGYGLLRARVRCDDPPLQAYPFNSIWHAMWTDRNTKRQLCSLLWPNSFLLSSNKPFNSFLTFLHLFLPSSFRPGDIHSFKPFSSLLSYHPFRCTLQPYPESSNSLAPRKHSSQVLEVAITATYLSSRA